MFCVYDLFIGVYYYDMTFTRIFVVSFSFTTVEIFPPPFPTTTRILLLFKIFFEFYSFY